MKNFFSTALATGLANIISFLIYQGFVHSKWGQNIREEITRGINNFTQRIYKNGR
jgi:hypothetical protein